jgi:6-phosphofructokinase 1
MSQMPQKNKPVMGLFTSGGDGPGMNAALRAIVRTALHRGVEVYAIYEGYQGMVAGGSAIRQMAWDSVGGILHQGGTIIGTARSAEFRERAGRLKAALNLVQHAISRLIVIGGDGSLTGANIFRQEWPGLLTELVANGSIDQATADRHPALMIVGLVGSIDNDMAGTDTTIGADTALHRITQAVDAISSTAASHQRTFVVEVMGRRCGYLALMGGLATAADWVLLPESPPDLEDWEGKMCQVLRAGREAGRRDSIVLVAEGAQDRDGQPISSTYIKQVLEERLGEDTRVTILGHVQRGGAPSAFDRSMSTLLGHAAVGEILAATPDSEPVLLGTQDNQITRAPLMECVAQTHAVADALAAKDYERAMELRGNNFKEALDILHTLVRALPHPPQPGQKRLRLAVMHAGSSAPGMNSAVRAAVRLGLDQGHVMLGIQNGFVGFVEGKIVELGWMDVAGLAWRGGSELGTNRKVPAGKDLYAIARNIEEHQIEGLLLIGGWQAYEAGHLLCTQRENFPAFDIPLVCLPASINNNLPGTELSVGADTALNNIIGVLDKIKQSAVAERRCFVVEVMGRYCGYLAMMSGLAVGAERVYLHEEGVTLAALQADLENLMAGFKAGKRLGLIIRNENANPIYTTGFMRDLFEEEGGGLFEVRQAILGHLQQGGDPSPADRALATRLAAECINFLIEAATTPTQHQTTGAFVGLTGGELRFYDLLDWPRLVDEKHQRPKEQWWLKLRSISNILDQPGPELG